MLDILSSLNSNLSILYYGKKRALMYFTGPQKPKKVNECEFESKFIIIKGEFFTFSYQYD